MDTLLALEILGGPMDGTRLKLTERVDSAKIGRQVGNHLTLAFDMTISRWHATIEKQGTDFYLKDEKSISGTWVNGERIDKVRIQAGMVFLVGGTIIQVQKSSPDYDDLFVDEACFEDPQNRFRFGETIKPILNDVSSKEDDMEYGSISGILQHPSFHNLEKLSGFKCMQGIAAFDFRKILPDWINKCEIRPIYRFENSQTMLITPRLWHVFELASQNNAKEISVTGFLKAVLDEKLSLPGRFLRKDRSFVQAVSNEFKEPDIPPDSKPTDAGEIEKLLMNKLVKFESILEGFIKDAQSSGISLSDTGMKKKGNWLRLAYQKNDIRTIESALKRIEKNFVAIMAAHREANRLFEREILGRINEVLPAESIKNVGLFSADDSQQAIAKKVRSVLKESELEGLADQIVRQAIKEKILS